MTDIAFISTYPPQSCGVASYTQELVRAIVAADRSVSVTILAEHGAASSSEATVWPCFDGADEYVAPLLDRLSRLMPSVVHVQHEYGIFGVDERFHQLLAGIRAMGLPVVVTLHTVHTALSIDHGCAWRNARQPLGEIDIETYQRKLGHGADIVIAHQEAVIREVLIRQGLPRQRVVTIPHGTPISSFSRNDGLMTGAPRRPPVVAAFGYFEPSKNYEVLVEAISLLHVTRPGTRLILGGHIRYPSEELIRCRSECEEKISELGLGPHVEILHERVPDEHVDRLLATADAACFIYDEDTRSSSGALHRAVGCGVPVVVSRIPKFAEVSGISDELVVSPRSPEQVARVLSRLLSDATFRDEMQRRTSAFAQQTSWERVASRHLRLYRDQTRKLPPRVAAAPLEALVGAQAM